MSHIDIDFNEVPDKVQPLEPGLYTLRIEESSTEPTVDGKGTKVVLKLRVNDPASPQHDRVVYDYISTKMTTQLKRVMLSGGLKPGAEGLDVSALVGITVRARVKLNSYQDKATGETKTNSKIADYLIPGDQGA